MLLMCSPEHKRAIRIPTQLIGGVDTALGLRPIERLLKARRESLIERFPPFLDLLTSSRQRAEVPLVNLRLSRQDLAFRRLCPKVGNPRETAVQADTARVNAINRLGNNGLPPAGIQASQRSDVTIKSQSHYPPVV